MSSKYIAEEFSRDVQQLEDIITRLSEQMANLSVLIDENVDHSNKTDDFDRVVASQIKK